MADPKKFIGRYQLIKSDNFDAYMKALNVGFALRTLGNTLKPSVEIANEGDTWFLRTHSTFKNTEQKFKFNEQFDEETIDGRQVKTVITIEDGKLVQRQKATKADEKDSDIIRELVNGDELVTTLIVKDPSNEVTAKRFYKREWNRKKIIKLFE